MSKAAAGTAQDAGEQGANSVDSRPVFEKQFEITNANKQAAKVKAGGESDSRLTTVVNIRPAGGITSCRSNNDVARHTFNRSPHQMNQSPLSVGLCQQVLSGNNRHQGRDSSLSGRYGYLRSVGNAVVQDDIRKSVDRIRVGSEHEQNLKSKKSDLVLDDIKSRFEEAGRRGTAPYDVETSRQPKSALDHQKPDFATPVDVSWQNNQTPNSRE